MRTRSPRLLFAVACLAASPAFALQLVGSFDTAGSANDVAVQGNLAYVADGTQGLRILDVSNPAAPVPLGGYAPSLGNSHGVVVVGTRAYLAAGFAGLAILDVSNPGAPTQIGQVAPGFFAQDVAVVGPLAYVTDLFGGLNVIDVGNPAAAAVVGASPSLGGASGVAVSGSIAYVIANGTLQSVDVSNPTAPVVLQASTSPVIVQGFSPHIAAVGNQVFLPGGNQGLAVVDATNPSDMRVVYPSPIQNVFTSRGVRIVGSIAYVTDGYSVQLFDISDALAPPSVELGEAPVLGVPSQVRVSGAYAYVSNGYAGGLQIFAFPGLQPALVGHTLDGEPLGGTRAVTSGGTTLVYAASNSTGLRIVDATDPANPAPLGTAPIPGSTTDVDVTGHMAYVVGSAGLHVIDVSSPTAPHEVGSYLGTSGVAVKVVGTRAYLAGGGFGAAIFDVSNPSLPLYLGQIYTPDAEVEDLAVAGNLVYLANRGAGLRIFNASNPTSPVALGQLVLDDEAFAVDVQGSFAYLPTFNALNVVDVSNPAAPKLRTRVTGAYYGTDVAVSGIGAFVTTRGATPKLEIWNATSLGGLGPRSIGSLGNLGPNTSGVAADPGRGLVFVADGTAGLLDIDASVELAAHPCIDGIDNDGDGKIDMADDGCTGGDDPSEKPDCADGIDNDGDGLVDYPADPGCRDASAASRENPQCSDGVDNDGDGKVDFPADPQCQAAWGTHENASPGGCGLGAELALVLGACECVRRGRLGARL